MSLSVFVGPMFAGKTTRVKQKLTKYADCLEGSKCLLINYMADKSREQKDGISCHSSGYKGLSEKITVVSAYKLADVDVTKFTHIGIDEGQFYEDLKDTVKKWLDQGKYIVVVGLDSTAEMKAFGQIADLLPIADDFKKCKAICSFCVKEIEKDGQVLQIEKVQAAFTRKIVKSNSSSTIDIGGAEKYAATCRRHFTA